MLALTALVLVGLVEVFLRGQILSRSGERITLATDHGVTVLERIRSLGFDTIPEDASFDSKAGDTAVDGFPPFPYEPDTKLTTKVTTRLVSPTMKSVVVEVEFNPGRFLTLEAYVRP